MPASPSSQQNQTSEVEMDLTADGQELDVTKGEPASTVKASVKLLGGQTLPRELWVALRNSKLRVVAWQQVNSKGEAEFQDVVPGNYEVLVQTPGKAYSVAHISSPNSEMAGHILNVAAGQSLTVALSVVGGAANVEGLAKQNGKAMAGAMVVLVPKNPESNRELFRRDQSDLDGSFSLLSVIPDAYTVCAIENGWDLDLAKTVVIGHYCQHGRRIIIEDRAQGSMHLPDAVEVQPR
jgi:hypothetical protein